MQTYTIVMSDASGSTDLAIKAESLGQAAFIAGAHWSANVATTRQAKVFGVESQFNYYLPALEDGRVTVTVVEA